MPGDPCICGAAIWHPRCYASFQEFFKTKYLPDGDGEFTKANIRQWKEAMTKKHKPPATGL